ncbi:MAG TPA: hypothetical protein PLN55_11475 [Burkholderiaceae bacterium]|nr:hypothetical protein [Burkholderiaceae bacterium]
MDGFVTKSQFATILGTSRAYVSQLVAAKRIVLSDDGKLVHVEPSLKLMNVTADPSKAGVRERWAAFREGRELPPVAPPAQAEQPELLPTEPPPSSAAAKAPATSAYHDARTLREQAEAELAQIELLKARGRLLEADSTLRAIVDAHASVRNELLGLADRVTPLVAAETDPRKVWELVHAECKRLAERVQLAAQQMAQAQGVAA